MRGVKKGPALLQGPTVEEYNYLPMSIFYMIPV